MTGAPDALLTHRTLGDFTVGAKLGEGGHGVVYRAEQRGLGREAVIKVLRARHGAAAVRAQAARPTSTSSTSRPRSPTD